MNLVNIKILTISLALLLVFLSTYFISQNIDSRAHENGSVLFGRTLPALQECVTSLGVKDKNSSFLKLTNECYIFSLKQGYLNDFQTRRAHFSLQYDSGKIILWMVVIITLSGVLLSALQLVASYRLAVASQQHSLQSQQEFSVEEGKLVFKSSVTGLFILLFSFAFFFVYVWKVYAITEVAVDGGDKHRIEVSQRKGGLGPVPNAGTKQETSQGEVVQPKVVDE